MGHVCDNVGLVNATNRLKELQSVEKYSVDMNPAVFREDLWDIEEVDGFTIRNIKFYLTSLRLNPIITSVMTFTAKMTNYDEYGDCEIELGCVSRLDVDCMFKIKCPDEFASHVFSSLMTLQNTMVLI